MDGFTPIDTSEPLDTDALIARVPANRRIRGFFLHYLVDFARRQGCDVAGIRRVPDPRDDVSLRVALRGTRDVARALYPTAPIREALRRTGWLSIPALMSSPLSRVLFGVAMRSPGTLLRVAPTAARMSGSSASIRIIEQGPGLCVLAVQDYLAFRDGLVGAAEAGLASVRRSAVIAMRAFSEERFDLCVRWAAAAAPPPGRYGPSGEVQM